MKKVFRILSVSILCFLLLIGFSAFTSERKNKLVTLSGYFLIIESEPHIPIDQDVAPYSEIRIFFVKDLPNVKVLTSVNQPECLIDKSYVQLFPPQVFLSRDTLSSKAFSEIIGSNFGQSDSLVKKFSRYSIDPFFINEKDLPNCNIETEGGKITIYKGNIQAFYNRNLRKRNCERRDFEIKEFIYLTNNEKDKLEYMFTIILSKKYLPDVFYKEY